MARALRMESEAGVYHVLNRGNYRTDLFRADATRQSFLNCLGGACERTGWLVHAWCIMSNHYHLAISTPRGNLVEGMKWLQGTFAVRFNRHRSEHGHIFEGRYKSLIVESGEGLGPLCHYIHLNPVRAHLCQPESLPRHRWTSIGWLMAPPRRPAWYDPRPFLHHAGDLVDSSAGRAQYLGYLRWLAEDEPAQKRQHFDRMSRAWAIGTAGFAAALFAEHQELAGCIPARTEAMRLSLEERWREILDHELQRRGRSVTELAQFGKSEDWKVELGAAMKARTTVTNRWLSQHLHLGAPHEVSRKVSAWIRQNGGRPSR